MSNNFLIAALICSLGLGLVFIVSITQATPVKTVTNQAQVASKEDMREYDQQYVMFYSQIFLNRNRTEVSFSYAFDQEIELLILGFEPTNERDRSEVVISHPQLTGLGWSNFSQEDVTLYQKSPSYTSLAEFLANPPAPETIATDHSLARRYSNLVATHRTDSILDLEQIDYILTTYQPSTFDKGIYNYRGVIDASKAKVSDADQIIWYITAPMAADKEVKYYLGSFNINYLQF